MSDRKQPQMTVNAPNGAYREYRSFDAGLGDEIPRADHDYQSYRKLGVIPYADDSRHAAKLAKERFGKHAEVFYTARGWVAYTA